ncbi:uncharacterized protein LOC131426986 [Malaya genurostris]|uniref:uncharacterized protein LOC131426986 n=1 Tax=Malaya genurostris TaxID=325434 RepID=UPI0026F3DE44|nr:uncharacterized protein LOC131426986 [Malaya genurostris]
MYIDFDLLSLQRKGCLAAVWLAATNKTLFRRHFKRGQCDRIVIDDLCKSILDCANTNKPLILVAKLAYGATYIYQQQVQFLYDRASSALCNQSIAFKKLTKRETPHQTDKKFEQNEITFEDVLDSAALSTEAVISQLMFSDVQTHVQRVDSITLEETSTYTTITANGKLFDAETDFGEMHMNDVNEFLDANVNSTIQVNSTGIVESYYDDHTLRDVSVPGSNLECPSIAILNMPIVSTLHFDQINGPNINNNTRDADEFSERSSQRTGKSNPNRISLSRNSQERLDLVSITPSIIARKRKPTSRLTIDKKNKLDADIMQRAMKESFVTQRCTDPRTDIIPIHKIRYPFDGAALILQYPVRNIRSSLLPYLFTRNTRKRSVPIEDNVVQSWVEELETTKKRKTGKETYPNSILQSGEQLHPLLEQVHPFEIMAPPTETSKTAETDSMKINAFDEENLLKVLSRFWRNSTQAIHFKFIEEYFSSRSDAATCFASILVLVSKQIIVVSTNQQNNIVEIKQGRNFQ